MKHVLSLLVLLAMLLAVMSLSGAAVAQDNLQGGYDYSEGEWYGDYEDEWYDPTDWFDGNNYEFDDTVGTYDGGYYDEGYTDDDWFYDYYDDNYNYGYDGVYDNAYGFDYDYGNWLD